MAAKERWCTDLQFDKSAIQVLSKDEASWFGHFFRPVIAPIFLMEALGDLKKDPKLGMAGDAFVASLANKIDVLGSTPNTNHHDLVLRDLVYGDVEMGFRPHRGGGQVVVDEDGERGLFFDEAPEEKMLQQWRDAQFDELERELASQYRQALKGIDLNAFPRSLAKHKGQRFTSLEDAAIHCAHYVDSLGGYKGFRLAADVFDLSEEQAELVKESWNARGRPALHEVARYARYALVVYLSFGVGLAHRLITTRPSNFVDLQYLYYLPFASIFVTGDKMQSDMAFPFLHPRQTMAPADLMKASLAQLVLCIHERDEELRQKGRAAFRYPPLNISTVIHALWDRHMPGWREAAVAPPPPSMSEEEKAKLLARLKKWDAARKISGD